MRGCFALGCWPCPRQCGNTARLKMGGHRDLKKCCAWVFLRRVFASNVQLAHTILWKNGLLPRSLSSRVAAFGALESFRCTPEELACNSLPHPCPLCESCVHGITKIQSSKASSTATSATREICIHRLKTENMPHNLLFYMRWREQNECCFCSGVTTCTHWFMGAVSGVLGKEARALMCLGWCFMSCMCSAAKPCFP